MMGLLASAMRLKHMVSPSTPTVGELSLFAKSDNSLWVKKSDGIEDMVGGLVGAIPRTSVAVSGSGWSGSISYQKYGNVVTVVLEGVSKSSWGVNDVILSGGVLPVAVRPESGKWVAGTGMNGAVDNAPRTFWINDQGQVYAAASGSGSIWGVATYQTASVERSTAMASGAEAQLSAGVNVTLGSDMRAYVRGGIVTVNINLNITGSVAASSVIATLPEGFRPALNMYGTTIVVWGGGEPAVRLHINTDGTIRNQSAHANGDIMRGSVSFPAALSAAGLGTLLDTGWVDGGTMDVPNVPQTTNFFKYRRVGNTVTMRGVITLTAGISAAYLGLPYPLAAGTLLSDAHVIGRVRAIRSGVSWYQFDVCAERISPGRAAIYLQDGSGAQVTATSPAGATWASGDRWGFDVEYEAAPL